MTTITHADVKRISKLACIKLFDDEVPNVAKELGGILTWVESLQNVNTDGIQPIISATSGSVAFCPDISLNEADSASILKNAPKSRYNYFVLPKVMS